MEIGDMVKIKENAEWSPDKATFEYGYIIDIGGPLFPYKVRGDNQETDCFSEGDLEKIKENRSPDTYIDYVSWSKILLNCGSENYEEIDRWYFKDKTNKKGDIMKKLSSTLKRVLSKPLQQQYKADLRNGDLELTERGRKELLEILAAEKEAELTKVADEIIKECEDKK